MKRKFLEDLGLEKEQIDKILDEASADLGRVKGELEKARDDLKVANKTIDDIKAKTTDNNKLQAELDDYKAKYEASEAERVKQAKNHAVMDALKDAKAKDLDYMAYKLGEVEMDENGQIIDLENRFKDLTEAYPGHFEVNEPAGEPSGGQQQGSNGYKTLDTDLPKGDPSGTQSLEAQINAALGI